MSKATLVVMAAGIGSRYGGGIKQLAAVGPNGEIIVDYSVFDAVEAGFDKVVFVIRKDLEEEFRRVVGSKIERKVKVFYVYQEMTDIPERFCDRIKWRTKPWGTGQAILCCKEVVKEPFLVINADDYYGKEAYREAYRYLMDESNVSKKMQIGMVGFILKNTLSENGTVTRGVCKVNSGLLTEIKETYGIEKKGNKVIAQRNGEKVELDINSPVSMNMWALQPSFFSVLQSGFSDFLERLRPEDGQVEYLLPQIIGNMLENNEVVVNVLASKERWFGVTYKEDKEIVHKAIGELVEKGVYPQRLYP